MTSYYNSVQLQRTPLFVINIRVLELIGTLPISMSDVQAKQSSQQQKRLPRMDLGMTNTNNNILLVD